MTETKVEETKKEIPDLRAGQTVRVHQKIKELVGEEGKEKERIQIFEGVIIAKSGGDRGINATITVRKISNDIGVEKIFPIHAPAITKIEVVKEAKVRRAKLFFLRDSKKKLKEMSA